MTNALAARKGLAGSDVAYRVTAALRQALAG